MTPEKWDVKAAEGNSKDFGRRVRAWLSIVARVVAGAALCASLATGAAPSPTPPAAANTDGTLLAIKINGKFYNRASGFKVKNGRLSFMHLQGIVSVPVEELEGDELSQLPRELRDQIAAEVIAEKKRREEEARLAAENRAAASLASTGGRRRQAYAGSLAGPKGSLRFIPVEPEGGGKLAVEKVPPRAGGALDGRTAGLDGEFGTTPRASEQVRDAIEAHARVGRAIVSADTDTALNELSRMSGLTAVSKEDGKYIDQTVLDASFKVFKAAFEQGDVRAGQRAIDVIASVGGMHPEAVKFLQESFTAICEMAEREQFEAIGPWMECLEQAGPSYGIVLEMGRQRVARKVLRRGLMALEVLRFKEAWFAYGLSKELWTQNPELAPIGLIAGVGGFVGLGFCIFAFFWVLNRIRAWRAWRRAASRAPQVATNWVVRRTDPAAMASWNSANRPASTRPKPRMRQPPVAD